MAPLKIRKSKGCSYQGQKSEKSTEQLLRNSHSSDIASLGILNSEEQSTESIDSWEEVEHEDDSMCSRGQSLDYPSLGNRSWASNRANTVAAEFGHHSGACLDSPDRITSSQSSLNSMSTHRLSTLTPHQDYQEPSTSHDISSRQFDASSAATSLCGADSDEEMPRDIVEPGRSKGVGKKESKMSKREIEKMNKEERRWNATDAQVLEHLLMNKGSVRAWRAVARARGLCSLSDGCRCTDCQADYLEPAGLEEDAGLGAGAPMISEAFAHGVAPACQIL